MRDEINATRHDPDAIQKIYEKQVRARVELGQFYKALRECYPSAGGNVDRAIHENLKTEVQQIDAKLGQIISTLETEKNVSSMPLVEMAQHMQHESQLQAKRDEHDHPFDHGAKLLLRAVADNACSVGAGVEFGGGKYEIIGNAGPAFSHACII